MKQIVGYTGTMNHVRIDEFDELVRLVDLDVAASLPAAQDPVLNTFYTPFHANRIKEEEIMKPVMASPLTPVLENANRERSIETNAACHVIETNANNEFEPDRKAAAVQLLPIVHAYRGITTRTLTGETSYIRNFLFDLTAPENAAAVALLDLTGKIARIGSLNDQFEDFLTDREHSWAAHHTGSLKPVRRDIGFDFRYFAECTNLHYRASVLNGAPSAALEKIIDGVNDIFRPFRRSLAHRGVHLPSEDLDFQTPDTTNPPAPSTPNQPPATGPQPLDPNEHPSMGEH